MQPSRHAWDPAQLTVAEVSSIKAIASQHPLGFEAIIEKICRFNEVSFAAGDEAGRRETDYAEGKRAVAYNILQAVKMKLPSQKQTGDGPHAVPKGAPPER